MNSRLAVSFLDVAAFFVPLLRFVEIEVLGRLYFTEILLGALLPVLFVRFGRRLSAPLPRTVIWLLVVWLLAQVVTDLIRGSAFFDYARGWAMIGFALSNFGALYLLLDGRPRRIVLFAVGAALGTIVGHVAAPSDYALAHPWKFGYGTAVTWLLVLLAVRFARGRGYARLCPAAVLFTVAALNIFMSSRAVGGIAFLAGCYLAAHALHSPRFRPNRIRPRQLAVLGAVAAVGAWGALQFYEHAVQAGWLGWEGRHKYEMQAYGDYGLLVGGRSEILVSSRAVLESPLIGHGSWAKDCRYASLYTELKREAGYFPGEENEQCLIPAHSHLMGSWVQAGFLGAAFWLWVLMLPIRTLGRVYASAEPLAPFVVFLALSLLWDIFFSPFAGERRFITPFYIVVMISYLPGSVRRRYASQVPSDSLREVHLKEVRP